jgi:hypothetical protein
MSTFSESHLNTYFKVFYILIINFEFKKKKDCWTTYYILFQLAKNALRVGLKGFDPSSTRWALHLASGG